MSEEYDPFDLFRGKFDEAIESMLKQGLTTNKIVQQVIRDSQGHINPIHVQQQVNKVREGR